jgi:hypothetical protein
MAKKSPIHIKAANKGKFTATAKKMGLSVQSAAKKILQAPAKRYSAALRKEANFARNAKRWKKR